MTEDDTYRNKLSAAGQFGNLNHHTDPTDDGIIVQLPDGDLVTLFRSQIPARRKVNVDELFAAFNVFHRASQEAMKYWSEPSKAEAEMAQARDEFRTFCEIHGLAEHIDWTPPE